MDERAFWDLIEAAKAECDPTSEDEADWQPALLQRRLEALPPAEIVAFDRILHTLHARAYRWDLWAAAYIIEGGCGDDGFTDFRSGLIGLGRDAYFDALRDPSTLARQPTHGVDFSQEEMLYVARWAYEAVTGDEIPEADVEQVTEPAGDRWDKEKVYEMYPELAAKFGRR